MFLRLLRSSTASLLALVALVAVPALARADVQILVAEVQVDATGKVVVDGSGNPVVIGSVQTYTGTPLSTADFASISVNSTDSAITHPTPSAVGSLTTTVTANPNGANATTGGNYGLEVIYRESSFNNINAGGLGSLTNNNAAASAGLVAPGTNTAEVSTQLFTGVLPGTLVGLPSGTATQSIDNNGVQTNGPVVPATPGVLLPATYGMQQTIFIITSSTGGLNSQSTLGGTLSSTALTQPAAVPAPAGLFLALAAAPIFGLRRVLSRKMPA